MGYCKYLKANCDDMHRIIDKCASCKRRNDDAPTSHKRASNGRKVQWYLIGLLPNGRNDPAYWIDRWLWIHAENVNAAKSHWISAMNGFIRHDELRYVKSFGSYVGTYADLPPIRTWAREHGYLR